MHGSLDPIDWTTPQRQMFNASRMRLSESIIHLARHDVGMVRGEPRCHRIHRTNENGCTATPKGTMPVGVPLVAPTQSTRRGAAQLGGNTTNGGGMDVATFKARSRRRAR